MALTERLALVITGDSKGAVKAISDVGKAADRELGKADKRFEKTGLQLQRLGAGAVAVGGVFAAGLTKAAQKAGELEQAVGGTQAVFGEASGYIDKYAKDSARSLGLSERAFRESTTRLGGALKGLGFETDDAAERAVNLTSVAADLAATYGGTTADAVDALAAAMRGEADPAERFNLFLNQSRVNAKAVAMGLAETTSQVDAHAAAQARIALILEQSADAQGQFSRESGTLIGQQQIVAAEAENAAAALGEGFMPVLQKVTGIAGDAATGFSRLNDSTGGLASTLAAIGTVGLVGLGGLSFAVGTVLRSFDTLSDAAKKLKNAIVSTAEDGSRQLGKLGAAAGIGGAAGAMFVLASALDPVLNKTRSLNQVVSDLARTTDQELIATFEEEFKLFSAAGREMEAFEKIARENVGTAQRLADAYEQQGVDVTLLREAIEREIQAQRVANADTERAGEIVNGATEATDQYASSVDAVTGYLSAMANVAKQAGNALRSTFDNLFGLANVSRDVDKAFLSFNDSLKTTSSSGGGAARSVDVVAEKQKKLEDATRSADSALRDHARALDAVQDAQRGLEKAQEDLERALRGPSDEDRAEAADDLADANLSLEDATFAVEDAQKRLTEAQAKGDPSEITRAQNDLEQALIRRNRAQRALTAEQERYNSIANWTKENDPKVAAAQDGVAAANKRLEDATWRADEALRQMNEAQAKVQEIAAASPAALAGVDRAMGGTRSSVLSARDGFLDLSNAIVGTIEDLVALDIAASKKVGEFDRIISLIQNNPALSQDQKNALLLAAWQGKADVINTAPLGTFPIRHPLETYDTGGVVPGPVGQSKLAMVHAGETIIPTHKPGVSFGGSGVSIGQVTINMPPGSNGEDVVRSLRQFERRNTAAWRN